MSLYSRWVLLIAKFIFFLLRILGLGAGGTWPGEVALRLNPRFLSAFDFSGKKVIFVLGTNGKTTTCKMIQIILSKSGGRVVVNDSGANLDNGIASALVADTDLLGRLKSEAFVFEIDEASLERVSKYIKPDVVVLLNLFRDQLDRYGEVDSVAGKWGDSIRRMSGRDPSTALRMTTLMINGDDPQLAYLGSLYKGEVKYFGINNPELFLVEMQHATDSIHCPKCGKRLTFGGVYFSHLGKYACGQCGFTHPKMAITSKDVTSPLPGVYNLYNVMAAMLVTQYFHLSLDESKKALGDFKPAFGRSEKLIINGKVVKILLSKNPTGFNESLRTALTEGGRQFLFVLNDRIPDGTDVSWIWDVDFEMLRNDERPTTPRLRGASMMRERDERKIIVCGERAYDLGLRLKYAGIERDKYVQIQVEINLIKAIQKSLEMLSQGETLYILPTYSAMLEVRKILTGKKIL